MESVATPQIESPITPKTESPTTPKRESPNGKQRLLNFLRRLLDNRPKEDCIEWVNEQESVFKLTKPHKVAELWGAATGNPTMTYDKMSRGLRYFYKNETLRKIPGKDSRYQFLGTSQQIATPSFNIANLFPIKNENGNSSLPSSPTSTSSGGSASTSPPQLRVPIGPMPNLLATMDATQIFTFVQNLSAQFDAFKAQNPIIHMFPDQDQIQIFFNFKISYPLLLPATLN